MTKWRDSAHPSIYYPKLSIMFKKKSDQPLDLLGHTQTTVAMAWSMRLLVLTESERE